LTDKYHHSLAGPSLIAWDPSGARIAVIVREGVAVVRVGSSEVQMLSGPRREVSSLAWSPDGETVVAHDNFDLRRVRVSDDAELWRAAIGQISVDDVLWSPDGRKIACPGDDLVVCDADTGATLWRRTEQKCQTVVSVQVRFVDDGRDRIGEQVGFADQSVCLDEARWSPDGTLVAACWDGVFRVLDGRDGAVKAEGSVKGGVMRWGPWGEAVFIDGELRLALCTARIEDRWVQFVPVFFSDDGRFVAAEGDRHCLWIQDEHGPRALVGHPRTITDMAWSSTGELATACRDGVIRHVSRRDGHIEEWSRLDEAYVSLAWSPDGTHLAVGCRDALVILSR
jgi:WD40 repeat protein